ncbi:MAG: hypothetical protein K2H18_08685, partial [Muribaculaceae bacterium]|nr:hypothetical protein [Muribaculaceae bacterium]
MTKRIFKHILSRKALSVLALAMLGSTFITTACNGNAKSSGETDSASDSAAGQYNLKTNQVAPASAPTAPAPKQSFTAFKVNSYNVRIPDIDDFKPLTDKMAVNGRAIKTITFYTLSVSGGLGSMQDDYEPFMRARTIAEAKKYSNPIMAYKFDRDGNVTEWECDYMEGYEFYYDSKGHPIHIIDEADGYRGSPSYKVRYDITWDNDRPTSYTRKVLMFESGAGDSTANDLEFESDFSADTAKFVRTLVRNAGSRIKVSGNSCK